MMLRFLVIVSLVFALGSQTTISQQFPPLQRQPVLDAAIPDQNPPIKLVHGAKIRFSPGQPTGLHRHPASVVGTVIEGSFVFQPEGEPAKTLNVGDSFFEPAGKTIMRFDNASNSQSAAIVAYYLTDSPKTPLIEMLSK